ncbi:element excision factor XisI family protein [Nostoc sp. PA-18-2419]
MATDLVRAGVAKQDILLAFHEPKMRQYIDFAVAF